MINGTVEDGAPRFPDLTTNILWRIVFRLCCQSARCQRVINRRCTARELNLYI